VQVRTS